MLAIFVKIGITLRTLDVFSNTKNIDEQTTTTILYITVNSSDPNKGHFRKLNGKNLSGCRMVQYYSGLVYGLFVHLSNDPRPFKI